MRTIPTLPILFLRHTPAWALAVSGAELDSRKGQRLMGQCPRIVVSKFLGGTSASAVTRPG